MNKNVIFIILGALAVSILVAVIVQSSLKKEDGGASIDMVEVLVAKKRIGIGQRLKAEDTTWQNWPKDAIYTGTIERSKQKDEENLTVYDQTVRRSIEKGEPVSTLAVIKESQTHNFLSASLTKDMRAFSVPVSAANSVGGFVRPGDYVDVLVTYSPRFRGDSREYSSATVERYAAQTVLQSLKVLAVDQRAKDDSEDGDAVKPGKTVTLEVSRKGAEKLALAVEMGDISLALRKFGEQASIEDDIRGLTTDISIGDVYKFVKTIEKNANVNTGTVRLYNGRQVENVTVRKQQD